VGRSLNATVPFREDGTMDGGGPAAPARRLGRVLRQLRDAAGKTQSEVAHYVGTAATTISKFENGERIPLQGFGIVELRGVSAR
jgi:hypothetical protein